MLLAKIFSFYVARKEACIIGAIWPEILNRMNNDLGQTFVKSVQTLRQNSLTYPPTFLIMSMPYKKVVIKNPYLFLQK
jgi:hypothetical protein